MAKASTNPTGVRKPTKAETAKLNAAAKANLEMPKDAHVVTDEQRIADRRADDQVKADAKASAIANFVQQETKPPVDHAAFEAELAALQAKHGVQVQMTVKPPKAVKNQQNGVTRPGEATTCGKIWATADAISVATHGVCPVAALKEHPAMKGINDHTIKTQYAKWRAFNGITGRLPKLHAVHQEAGEYAGLTPIA